MNEEFFGPLLTVYVYEDAEFESILPLVDAASPYALTLSLFVSDRRAIATALDALRNASGMTGAFGTILVRSRCISESNVAVGLNDSSVSRA